MIPIILGGLALGTAFGAWLESRRRKQSDSGWLPGVGMWPADTRFQVWSPWEECRDAAVWWEERLPGMFWSCNDIGLANVLVQVDGGGGNPYTVISYRDGKGNDAYVRMPQAHLANHRAWCHELGHVLGLGHDERYDSVMHPVAHDGPFVLTDHDRTLLKTYYGDRSSGGLK